MRNRVVGARGKIELRKELYEHDFAASKRGFEAR